MDTSDRPRKKHWQKVFQGRHDKMHSTNIPMDSMNGPKKRIPCTYYHREGTQLDVPEESALIMPWQRASQKFDKTLGWLDVVMLVLLID
jgi:hypothetical protein